LLVEQAKNSFAKGITVRAEVTANTIIGDATNSLRILTRGLYVLVNST
jgi:hypothetical protein